MLKIDNHPLTLMLQLYCSQYASLREDHLDMNNNLAFQRQYGLEMRVPDWPVLECVKYLVMTRKDFSKIIVIFSSTQAYGDIYAALERRVEYISWQEIFAGMQIANMDIRDFQKVRGLLESSDLTLFMDPPPLRDVVDQVRGCTNGCLVMLSKGVS